MDNESREMFQKLFDRLDAMDSRFEKMDSRFDKIDNRLNILELKQDRTAKKLDDLRIDVAVAERDIRRDIHELQDEMETVIAILKMNEMVPQ